MSSNKNKTLEFQTSVKRQIPANTFRAPHSRRFIFPSTHMTNSNLHYPTELGHFTIQNRPQPITLSYIPPQKPPKSFRNRR